MSLMLELDRDSKCGYSKLFIGPRIACWNFNLSKWWNQIVSFPWIQSSSFERISLGITSTRQFDQVLIQHFEMIKEVIKWTRISFDVIFGGRS